MPAPTLPAFVTDGAWPDLALRQGGAVAVWALPTHPAPEGGWAVWFDLLDAEERGRADRFLRPEDRDSYIAAHALLRMALSACLGAGAPGPAAWRFRRGAHGKPSIAGPTEAALEFNLSHARGQVVCALARSCAVGVDVECLGRTLRWQEIAGRTLTAAETLMLRALPPAEQFEPFLQLWTLKEALCKAVGEGLRMRFEEAGFELEPLRLVTAPLSAGAPEGWQFAQWRSAPDHIVALALRTSAPLEVLAWQTSVGHPWPARPFRPASTGAA